MYFSFYKHNPLIFPTAFAFLKIGYIVVYLTDKNYIYVSFSGELSLENEKTKTYIFSSISHEGSK